MSETTSPERIDAPPPAEAPAPLPAVSRPRSPRSVYARLIAEPRRFKFDAALRILARAKKSVDVAEIVRFRAPPGLGYAASDITVVELASDGAPAKVTTPVITLTGPTGVLPHLYTETLTTTLRNRSQALYEFLGALSHRTIAFFARAGTKYRINRAAEIAADAGGADRDPITSALLAFTGYGTPHLT